MLDARLQMPSETVRAIQPAELSAAFLHSEGTFVVVTAEQTFVWIGKASRLFPSSEAVKTLLLRVGRGATVQLMEGDEEADFWKALGGPGRYCKKDRRSHWVPRLFEGYALNGQLKMREVVNYSQWDLSEKGSYLLDCYDKLYVWYGTQCSETMKQSSVLVANTYIRLAATVREMYVGLELFMSGAEPLEFQWVFHTWSPKAVSSIEKAQERRSNRLHRLQLLEYRRASLEERQQRRARLAAQFLAENRLIAAANIKVREQDGEIERHNAKLESGKREDGRFEAEKLAREKARAEKEEAFKREMEEMEKERERKRLEREERKRQEEAAEAAQ